jgi:Tol biopolymer transport system component
MKTHVMLAAVLTLGAAATGWSEEPGCESGTKRKSVIAVYSNRHDVVSVPFVTWDIFLMDPDRRDASGMMTVWRRLEGPGGDWAPAPSPDGKGRIVFDSNRNRSDDDPLNQSELFIMKADGGAQRFLARGSSASWSGDGKSICFHASASGTGVLLNPNPGAPASDSVIFTAKVGDLLEGDAPTQLTYPGADDETTPIDEAQVDDDSDWSVDGRIAFIRKNRSNPDINNPTSAEIYTVEADGSGLTRLTDNAEEERSPAFSPDGQRIAYSCRKGTRGGNTLEICIMNADGTGVVKVTDNNLADLSPRWSADGTKLLFQRPVASPLPGQGQQTWEMDADGTVQPGTRLTAPPGTHSFPAVGDIKVHCPGEDHN